MKCPVCSIIHSVAGVVSPSALWVVITVVWVVVLVAVGVGLVVIVVGFVVIVVGVVVIVVGIFGVVELIQHAGIKLLQKMHRNCKQK